MSCSSQVHRLPSEVLEPPTRADESTAPPRGAACRSSNGTGQVLLDRQERVLFNYEPHELRHVQEVQEVQVVLGAPAEEHLQRKTLGMEGKGKRSGTAQPVPETGSDSVSQTETESRFVAYASLELLASSDPPSSVYQRTGVTGFHNVAQAGLELLSSGNPRGGLPKCWDHRSKPLCLALAGPRPTVIEESNGSTVPVHLWPGKEHLRQLPWILLFLFSLHQP
ncbi:hypothetical protein AAY473_031624 [Plecturocebus cupreus]